MYFIQSLGTSTVKETCFGYFLLIYIFNQSKREFTWDMQTCEAICGCQFVSKRVINELFNEVMLEWLEYIWLYSELLITKKVYRNIIKHFQTKSYLGRVEYSGKMVWAILLDASRL